MRGSIRGERKRPAWVSMILLVVFLVSFFKFLLTDELLLRFKQLPVIPPSQSYGIGTELVKKGNYYNMLDPQERSIYDSLADGIIAANNGCHVENILLEDYNYSLSRTVFAITADNPQVFWLNQAFTFTYVDNTVDVQLKEYPFKEAAQNFSLLSEQLDARVDEITKGAELLPTDYEKALFVHDAITESTEYDSEAWNIFQAGGEAPDGGLAFTAYGCLVNGKCVCEGYAKAYSLIMNKLNIPCLYINGETPNGSHAWNMITLDGENYMIDLTWDDPVRESEGTMLPNKAMHMYFCKTSGDFAGDHYDFDTLFEYPECTSETCDYYVKNGYCISDYDIDAVDAVLSKQFEENGFAEFRFADSVDFFIAMSDIQNENWNTMQSLSGPFSCKTYDTLYTMVVTTE